MTTHWLEHIEEAERWLGLAKNRADVPAKAADCLYEVIVNVARAVMELETDKHDIPDKNHGRQDYRSRAGTKIASGRNRAGEVPARHSSTA